MDNFYTAVIGFLIALLYVTMIVRFNMLSTQINHIQPTINEQICEELLPYGFRGRQEFVCYKGEEIEYSNREQYIIDQWKHSFNK